ncbi:hypothetical protein [Streptomyces sp. NPDC002403]
MSAPSEQLSLLAPDAPAHQPSPNTMRLLLFNAQHASPERSRRQAEWIAGQEGGDALVAALAAARPSDRRMASRHTAG